MKIFKFWLVCDDPMCSFRTKRLSCKFFNGRAQCIECEKYAAPLEYSDSDLYYQMKFFKFIFDVDSFKNYYKDDSGLKFIFFEALFGFTTSKFKFKIKLT